MLSTGVQAAIEASARPCRLRSMPKAAKLIVIRTFRTSQDHQGCNPDGVPLCFTSMALKSLIPAAGIGLLIGLLAGPLAARATADNDLARRSWIHTLNTELRAGIDYEAVQHNPITIAAFGVADVACANPAAAMGIARSLMNEAQASYAVQRFEERYCLVKQRQGA